MIRNIRVRNFKSLRDVSLKLGRRNVFIGPNMAGKSNLVSVFRFLTQMVRSSPGLYGLPNAISSQGGFAELAWRGDESNLLTISLDGDFEGIDNPLQAEVWRYELEILGDRQRGTAIVQNETLSLSGAAGETSLVGRDPAGSRRSLLSPSLGKVTEVPDSNRSALEFEVPSWEGNVFREFFASFQFYKLIPAVMKQVNPAIAPGFLEETGSNLSSWLLMLQTRHPESFARIGSVLKDVLPDVASLFTWPTAQSTVFVASSERFLRTPVPVWQMSDGELCFIAFLSLVFAPSGLGAPLFCVEEPEDHLHPKLIEALIGLHDQRQQELGARAAQVLVTTHSPYLVDKVGVDDVIVVEKREGATMCTRPVDKPALRELLTREEIGLGDLMYSGALGGK